MSDLGDQLRRAAEEADSWKGATAIAVVVTPTTMLRAFCEHVADEDEARAHAARLLANLVNATAHSVQESHAALFRGEKLME
jgi:hypothetical protein